MRAPLCGLVALALAALANPGAAAPAPSATLTRTGQTVSWSGELSTPDPVGCGDVASLGCDRTSVRVQAKRGSWVTMQIRQDGFYLRVETGGTYVASNGSHQGGTKSNPSTAPARVTFQQVRSGIVTYDVGVSTMLATAQTPLRYKATAVFAGKAFDREGECFVGGGGVDHVTDVDDGVVLPLSVLLVAKPQEVAEVKRLVVPGLVDTYSRIGIAVRAKVMAFPLKDDGDYPFVQVRRALGGVRPAGVDAVHVLSDDFAGGYAECLGGIAYPEFGFSNGSLHYAVQGVVPAPTVTAAVIAAHEIGHVLGAQHQQANCAEALPQLAVRPAKDGSVGPCTAMSPLAVQASQTFSTLERSTVRYYTRRYARG